MKFPLEAYSHKDIIYTYWKNISNVQIATYILERTNDNTTWELLTSSPFLNHTYQDLGLDISKEYRYRLKAEFVNGSESEYSYTGWISLQDVRVGYAFNNPDTSSNHYAEGWGKILTPDELRYVLCFGAPLVATNGDTLTDDTLQWYIDNAIGELERYLDCHIIKKQYRYRPSVNPQTGEKEERTDFDTSEKFEWIDPYDYNKQMREFEKYMYVKIRHRPIIDIQNCTLKDLFGNELIDLTKWMRINHKVGSVQFYPYQNAVFAIPTTNYPMAGGFFPFYNVNYPHAIFMDYTVGYENVEDVPLDLRNILYKIAGTMLLSDFGDGRSSALASGSVSLAGISESYATTMSATSLDYDEVIKIVYKGRIKKIKIGKFYKKYMKGKYKGKIEILSVNPLNIKQVELKEVTACVEHKTENKRCFKVKIGKKWVGITEDHSLFGIENNRLIKVEGKDLNIGDEIAIIKDGKVVEEKVIKIKEYKRKYMYDLSVFEYENFVLNSHIVVSNSAMYGAKILQWSKEIELWKKENAKKYQGMRLGILG